MPGRVKFRNGRRFELAKSKRTKTMPWHWYAWDCRPDGLRRAPNKITEEDDRMPLRRELPPGLSAMCECAHHWYVHGESGWTSRTEVCHGWKGSATPGPYEPCRCLRFVSWSGPRDARTGEPVKPLTLTTDARS